MVYEYNCYSCNEKYYSAAKIEDLNKENCQKCGGRIFYSIGQIQKIKPPNLNKVLGQLEKWLKEEKQYPIIESSLDCLDLIVKSYERNKDGKD